MTAFTILLGGDVTPTLRLIEQVAGTRVIAADSGMRHAKAFGILPELWLGDFDSSDPTLQTAYAIVPRQTYSSNKDATDGDLAITEALHRGAASIILVGATGGQFDHVLCHAMMLQVLHRRDVQCWMTNGVEECYPLQACTLKGHADGTRVSIVPTSNIVGLTLNGVKWPLKNKMVPMGSSLTLSNESEGDVEISFKSGEGLIIVYPVQK